MQNEQPRIFNNAPVKINDILPPHRLASCKSTWVEGMSHSEILNDIKEILLGNKKCLTNCWFNSLTNELVYRGVLVGGYAENNALIPSLVEWEAKWQTSPEFNALQEAQQGQGRHAKKT